MAVRSARRWFAFALPFVFATALLLLLSRAVGAAPTAAARFASTTGSGFACLRDNPCRLSIAVGAANTGDTIYVEGGTYTGVGAAVITVTKSMTIYGGWDGDPAPGRVFRDPDLYPTILDGQNVRRGVYMSGTFEATLEGFIITHGNASGLFAGCSPSDAHACGGGMFIYHSAAFLRFNKFVDNTAQLTAPDNHNEGFGGGLYIEVGTGSIITGNVFMSNTAAALYAGGGGGLAVAGDASAAASIRNNTFIGNVAPTWGGGFATEHSAFLTMYDNVFENNSALHGSGLYAWYADSFLADGNTFRYNSGDDAIYFGYTLGGLSNSLVMDNATQVGLEVFGGSGGAVDVVNNIFAHNGAVGIQAESNASYPLYLRPYHNTLVGGGSGTAVLVTTGPATVTLVNTLISGFAVGFASDVPTSTVASADYTLFDTDVGSIGLGALTHIFSGPAMFANAAGRDYHILTLSAARDVALVTTVGTDIDGDLRNLGAGPDIGADETRYLYALFEPLILR